MNTSKWAGVFSEDDLVDLKAVRDTEDETYYEGGTADL